MPSKKRFDWNNPDILNPKISLFLQGKAHKSNSYENIIKQYNRVKKDIDSGKIQLQIDLQERLNKSRIGIEERNHYPKVLDIKSMSSITLTSK